MNKVNITVNVIRLDPSIGSEPKMHRYNIPYSQGMSVSDAILLINEIYGKNVAFLLYCRQGICGSCMVKVNGQLRLACCTPADDDLTLEPAFPDLVIKDLVTAKGKLADKSKCNRRTYNGSKI